MPYHDRSMFGSHLSIAGGLHNALIEAQQLGMDCVQVFTKNQRQWKVKPLTRDQIKEWQHHRRETGIDMVVSHDSYLINLASPVPAMRRKSINLFRHELRRCDALDIPYLVTHPGAHMQGGEDQGLARVAESLDELHDNLPELATITCLEITAGQGTSLGYSFEHLRSIIDRVDQPHRLAVCLDTAHMLAAGYDLTSAAGCRRTLRELDDVLGFDLVRVIHVNDSKVERGRRVDRHDHIGLGHVAQGAFAVFVNHPRFRQVPKILETPKVKAPDGREWDNVNLETLRALQRARKPQKSGKARR